MCINQRIDVINRRPGRNRRQRQRDQQTKDIGPLDCTTMDGESSIVHSFGKRLNFIHIVVLAEIKLTKRGNCLPITQPHIRHKTQQPRQSQFRSQHQIIIRDDGRRAILRWRVTFLININRPVPTDAEWMIPDHLQRMASRCWPERLIVPILFVPHSFMFSAKVSHSD